MKTLPLLAAFLVVLCWCEAAPAQTATAANAVWWPSSRRLVPPMPRS